MTNNDNQSNEELISGIASALDEASGSMNIGPEGIYEMANELLKDPKFILEAISPTTNKALGEALTKPNLLCELLLADDTNTLGQIMQDKIIQYALNAANLKVAANHKEGS
ncbi:MAG: hypothetical protein OQK82_07685 [Candidatus Pacearchaeota archaeon]|nr:hypothetical protein [Candidatus Pacearchaeota archaeon]